MKALSGPQAGLSLCVSAPEKLAVESYSVSPIFPLIHFGNFGQTRRFASADTNFRLKEPGGGSQHIATQIPQDQCSGSHLSLGSTKHIYFQCSLFE